MSSSSIDHPSHYGGENNPYETIKVIEEWLLGFHLGNALKYISRAGKKATSSEEEDLKKAVWYVERLIAGDGYQILGPYGGALFEQSEVYNESHLGDIAQAWKLSPSLTRAIELIYEFVFGPDRGKMDALHQCVDCIYKHAPSIAPVKQQEEQQEQ